MTDKPLEGASAIVTGSARNIGKATALALAGAGAAVLINARNSEDAAREVVAEIEAMGGKAIVHMADVTDSAQVNGMVAAAVEAFGGLDILVNNVAARRQSLMVDTTDEDWRAVMSSAIDAAFYAIRASIPHLAKGGRGAIVNLGGVSGHAGVAMRSHVATAKAGIAGMTGSLAVELAPQNITVNCVAPGHIHTEREGDLPLHFQQKAAPLGREGKVEEIAGTILYLCGPAGRYTTGETIHVNGGWYVSIG
jgi:3-oxoacyl-[acyl-carrier protein] reductase